MVWVAIEDAGTHEVGDFGEVAEKDVQYLMDG